MNNLAKARIVVIGVVTRVGCGGFQTTTNNTPGSPGSFAGRFHRVFTVITTVFVRQLALPVAKHDAILVIPKGAALVNQSDHALPLARQLGQSDRVKTLETGGPLGHR